MMSHPINHARLNGRKPQKDAVYENIFLFFCLEFELPRRTPYFRLPNLILRAESL